jgi:glycerol uptake facilitator-like aquaporin
MSALALKNPPGPERRRAPAVETIRLHRRLVAEALGSALLLAVIIGSGIMAERLSQGNIAIALMGNTMATGAGLVALILVFGPVSGAHFNPTVTLCFALRREMEPAPALLYVCAQTTGAVLGVILAHAMFEEPLIGTSSNVRNGLGQVLGEFVASFGLIVTILGCLQVRPQSTPYAVGLFIVAGYWFTSSTSFANPAVTIARALTDSFSGIRLVDVPAFMVAQLAGAIAATLLAGWLFGRPSVERDEAPLHSRHGASTQGR